MTDGTYVPETVTVGSAAPKAARLLRADITKVKTSATLSVPRQETLGCPAADAKIMWHALLFIPIQAPYLDIATGWILHQKGTSEPQARDTNLS